MDLILMPRRQQIFKQWIFIVGLAILCWWGLTIGMAAPGSSLRLESRVDRLESELSRVQSRLNQLAARDRLPQSAPSLPTDQPAPLNGLSLAAQFDNLATLAIELRQDVRDLQARVAELEAKQGDR